MKLSLPPAAAVAFLVWPTVAAAACLSPPEAQSHVGENNCVCGVVASAHYAAQTKGQPTFLNLDKPYPKQIFTVVIWGSDRSKFGEPERTFRGKRVCATGKIELYRES